MSKESQSFTNPHKKPNSVCPFHDERAYPDMHRQSQNIQRVRGDLTPQADNFYDMTQKEEAYAYASLVIPETINYSIQQRAERGTFGLLKYRRDGKNDSLDFNLTTPVEKFYPGQEYDQLESSMRYTLYYDLKNLQHGVRYNSASLPTDLKDNFRALDELAQNRSAENGFSFIMRGINTASKVMSNTIELIPKLVTYEFPEEQGNIPFYEELGRNSYSLLRDMAKQHRQSIHKLFNAIELGDFGDNRRRSPVLLDAFTTTDNQVRIKPELLNLIEQSVLEKEGDTETDFDPFKDMFRENDITLGCPAVYGPTIKKLWNWHVDIGRHIWQQQAEREING